MRIGLPEHDIESHLQAVLAEDSVDIVAELSVLGDDDRAEFFRGRKLPARSYGEFPFVTFDPAGRNFRVLTANGRLDVLCGQSVRRHPERVDRLVVELHEEACDRGRCVQILREAGLTGYRRLWDIPGRPLEFFWRQRAGA